MDENPCHVAIVVLFSLVANTAQKCTSQTNQLYCYLVCYLVLYCHWCDFSGYIRISGFRFLSESNKNGVEMHFECDFPSFRIQTLTQSHPCIVFYFVYSCVLFRNFSHGKFGSLSFRNMQTVTV